MSWLEVVEGPDAGRRLPLESTVEVGRDAAAMLRLSDPQASRRHARISPAGAAAVVEDLGSSNGTFINGEPVYSPTMVREGDQILLGLSVIELRSQGEVDHGLSAVRAVPPALAVRPRTPDYLRVPERAEDKDHSDDLERLLDIRVKAKARLAPLGMLILVALATALYLALR